MSDGAIGMQVSFQRVDQKRHEVRIERADGTVESAVVESKSLLVHDLVHLAVETGLATQAGYFGRVASGASIDGKWGNPADAETLMGIELMVGVIQTLWRTETPPEQWPGALSGAGAVVDPELIARIHRRLRSLHGRWRATPFAETMTLMWGPDGVDDIDTAT